MQYNRKRVIHTADSICRAKSFAGTFLTTSSAPVEVVLRVPHEYAADFLDQALVREVASTKVVALQAGDSLEKIRAWIVSGVSGSTHQGFPVVDAAGALIGVLTRRDLLDPAVSSTALLSELVRRPPSVVYDHCTLRQAADHMVNHNIGRLPVITDTAPRRLFGMITRSDLLSAHRRRLADSLQSNPTVEFPMPRITR